MDREIMLNKSYATWLDRKIPLQTHAGCAILSLNIIITIVCITYSVIAGKNCIQDFKNGLVGRSEQKEWNRRFRRVDLTFFHLSIFNMLAVLLMNLADAYICVFALSTDAAEETWDRKFIMQIALYSLGVLAVFSAAFVLVPLVQMVLATFVISRIREADTGTASMSKYVPAIRACSSRICYFWTICSIILTFSWPPVIDTLTRDVILLAVWGSALGWMEASLIFTFHSRMINEEHYKKIAASRGMRQFIAALVETVKSAHAKDEKLSLLPSHGAEPESLNEKS